MSMIRPHKHLNPRLSVVYVSGMMIETLKDNRIMGFVELLDVLKEKIEENVKAVFLPSLSFLFLVGKIAYHQETDSIELLDKSK